jgi:hypothetical protein
MEGVVTLLNNRYIFKVEKIGLDVGYDLVKDNSKCFGLSNRKCISVVPSMGQAMGG